MNPEGMSAMQTIRRQRFRAPPPAVAEMLHSLAQYQPAPVSIQGLTASSTRLPGTFDCLDSRAGIPARPLRRLESALEGPGHAMLKFQP